MKSIEKDIIAHNYYDALTKIDKHKDEISSDVYWFNRGIIEKNLSDYVSSRFSFEKSKAAAPYNPRIYQELDEVETLLSVKSLETPHALSDYFHQGVQFLPMYVILTIFFIFYSLAALWTKMSGGAFRWLSLFCLGLFLGFMGKFYNGYYTVGIVNNEVQVREGPSQVFPMNLTIPKGTKIVLEKEGAWFKVVYPSQFSGWVLETQWLKLN